ncbi:MAG: response regulator [bacterium]|nr:response regulator [bacterium]
MTNTRLTLLAIDDDPADLEILRRHVGHVPDWQAELLAHPTLESAQEDLKRRMIDAILLDYVLGGQTGLDVLKRLRHLGDERPIIMLTGQGDERLAADLIREGANDYLVKGELTPDLLRRSVDGALARARLQQEKVLLEEQLRQSQRMETIGQLAGGIAHDFNNMLTGIMGYVELALLRARDQEIENDLLQIQSTCRHMADLIQRLLSFSRHGSQEFAPTDLCQALREVQVVLAHTLPKDTEMAMEMPDHELVINGSTAMLHQIFLNLCMNAAEAMPDGGHITVRASNVDVDSEPRPDQPSLAPGEHALLEVHDTGKGIDKESLSRIFEPLFTTKTLGKKKGTGLGLAVVWQNVRDHSGVITVYSEEGHGTTFRVYLPLIRESTQQSRSSSLQEIPTGSESILIVDDEQVVRNVASQMLQRLGYRVFAAADGVEALATYRELPGEIDAVLLDVAMPRMGGEECLRGLIDMDPEVRVIMSSGHDMSARDDDLVSKGAKGTIQKPYQLADLARRIRALLTPTAETC